MTSLKHSLIFALLFLCSGQLLATHIVGGGITYECLGDAGNGNVRYRFTMKVYRDCLNGTAQFDNPASIAIYRGSFQSNTSFANFNVALGSVLPVNVNQPDCINNLPNFCLQEATYTWERLLPVSNQSYFVEYQRCCRTNAIANILNPEDTGATYYVEITPAAQQVCNSSPVFNNFPPVVICNNYPLEVDYSVTDPDGDQLVYSFCAPYAGGSSGGGGNCNSPSPNPPCAPPFDEVIFTAPLYSASQPMGGNPIISINPQTGFISGTPNINGQFVVGVCVEEYRNGVLLSVTRRDFQFNVAPCAPQVTALVEYDELAGLQHYIIKNCGDDKTITIINESLPIANIDDFLWTFDLGNGTVIENSTDFDITIDFPDFGTYDGTLILNNGLDCGDTAFVQVQLYPPATLSLGSDIKVCKDSTIILDAGTGFSSYQWQDGSTGQTFTATTSGMYQVVATDSCGNIRIDSIAIIISPVPDINLADVSVCPGKSITLDVPGFTQYSWEPSAGLSCTDCQSVTIQPAASSVYSLTATNQDGCFKQDTFEVTVLPTPMQTYVIQFYPNETVTLGGQTYNQAGTVELDVPSTTGGCDSLNTYILEVIPTTLSIQCPANVTVALPNNATSIAVNYTTPGTDTNCPGAAPTVSLQSGLPSGGLFAAGLNTVCYQAANTCGDAAECCFTVMVATLDIQCPANVTVALPNNASSIAVNYNAPGTDTNCPGTAPTVSLLSGQPSGGLFAAGLNTVCYQATNTCGNEAECCFTVMVATIDIQCPPGQTVALPVAATTVPVDYAAPTTSTNCPDPNVTLTLIEGFASGEGFPLGLNKVCYTASNTCGNLDTCCFSIQILDAPAACDIKTPGCLRFELLDIRLDSIGQPRYRIRATNFCSSEVFYVITQTPNGIVGPTPVHGSIYTAPNTGNTYDVRSPNFSPFYSVRYKTIGVGLNNGQADVFEYRLTQQSFPTYIHVSAKLKNGLMYESHLNTFYCPVQPWDGTHENRIAAEGRGETDYDISFEIQPSALAVYPNPSSGLLMVDLSQWQGQSVQTQVLNAQGQLVLNRSYEVENDWLELNLDDKLGSGLYYLLVQPLNGERATAKFVLQR